jgi:hypothetical protein
LFALVILISLRSARADEESRLRAAIKERQTYLDRFLKGGPAVRAATQRQATLTVLSDEAIRFQAAKASFTASPDEISSALKPFLAQQGIIDLLSQTDLKDDANVALWLRGQGLTYETLQRSGQTLVLWTKIATAGVIVTEADVREFVEKTPQTRLVPARVQVVLQSFKEPANSPTRGLSPCESLAPRMSIALARAATENFNEAPKDWRALNLILNLDELDPNLRAALAGNKPGDAFGPIRLRNGAVISGQIKSLLSQVDLSRNAEFWKYAAIRARLAKADQAKAYDAVVSAYLQVQSPAVRGIFDDAFNWAKDNLSTVGTVAGAGIGLFFGGPSGAIQGAQIGNQVGTTLQGWVNGQPPTPQSIMGLANAAGVTLPPGFSLPPFPPPPPPPNSMRPFMQGPPPSMPPAYNFSPMGNVPWAPTYNQPGWAGMPMSAVPLPMAAYPSYFAARTFGFPPVPPPPPMWAPPMFMPYAPFMY